MVELVHQATIAKRQVQQYAKVTKGPSFTSCSTPIGGKPNPCFNSFRANNSGASVARSSHVAPNVKEVTTPSIKKGPTPSATSSVGSTSKSNAIQCFKCLGRGHIAKECPNNHAMLVNNEDDYDSTNEVEHYSDFERDDNAEGEKDQGKTL